MTVSTAEIPLSMRNRFFPLSICSVLFLDYFFHGFLRQLMDAWMSFMYYYIKFKRPSLITFLNTANKHQVNPANPTNQNNEDAGDGAYGLSSLSEKTRISNHLQMSLQRQHILLSYFKTLNVGPVWDSNLRPPAW